MCICIYICEYIANLDRRLDVGVFVYICIMRMYIHKTSCECTFTNTPNFVNVHSHNFMRMYIREICECTFA